MDWYKSRICEEIESHRVDLFKLSNRIWKYSQSHGKDFKNVERITKFLKKNHFKVTLNLNGMPDTFKAEYGVPSSRFNKRPNVAFLCRYDMAGKPSQFVGNNLVAETAVAAALGVKAALQASSPTIGKVTVIGCPDTFGGGVATLVNLKVFKHIDVVMLAIPGSRTDWCPHFLGRKTFRVTYKGHEGDCEKHTLAADEQKAVLLAYQNVQAVQEHFSKDCTAKVAIEKAVRPHEAKSVVCTAAPSNPELFLLEKRVLPCLEAAAIASGCEFEMSIAQKTFYSLVTNVQLCYMMQLNAYFCGTLSTPRRKKAKPIMDAIDVSNVSHVVPTLMPMFNIGTEAETGTPEFKHALRSQRAQDYTLAIAKGLAMTALDVLSTPGTMAKVKEELVQTRAEEKKTTFKPFKFGTVAKSLIPFDMPFDTNTGWSRLM